MKVNKTAPKRKAAETDAGTDVDEEDKEIKEDEVSSEMDVKEIVDENSEAEMYEEKRIKKESFPYYRLGKELLVLDDKSPGRLVRRKNGMVYRIIPGFHLDSP